MTSPELPSRIEELPLTAKATAFDYTELAAETRTTVQQNTSDIKSLMRRTSQDIVSIGQKLIEVKQQLEHGHFRKWLKAEFDWSVSTSTKFIQVSEQFKCVNFTHLNIASSALYLLAAPSTPEAARQEALNLANQGETITYSKAKEITQQYKKAAKPRPEHTTIDIQAKTLEESSIVSEASSQPPAPTSPTFQPKPDKQELQQKKQILLPTRGELLLQNSNNHLLSSNEVHSDYSPTSLFTNNTDLLCQVFINYVEQLNDAQIISVWYALAYRIPSHLRTLNNWPDAELKRFIHDIKEQLFRQGVA